MIIDYVKFSGFRSGRFALTTIIGTEGRNKTVSKASSAPESKALIKTIADNCTKLKQQYKNIEVCPCTINGDSTELIFAYIEGKPLSDIMVSLIQAGLKDEVFDMLLLYRSIIFDKDRLKPQLAHDVTPEFTEIFGEYKGVFPFEYIKRTNVDMLFSNLIYNNAGNYTIIDYEWVIDFPIPVKFVYYRGIKYFFQDYKYKQLHCLTLDESFELFGISKDDIATFDSMDYGFRDYVCGKNHLVYNRYRKQMQSFLSL